MDWEGSIPTTFSTITEDTRNSGWSVLPSTLAEQYTSPTLVRTRGMVYAQGSYIANASIGGIGLIIWPGDSGEDGLPDMDDLPGPLTDPELDWIYTWFYASTYNSTEITGAVPQYRRHDEIDSSAMRKIPNGHGILLVYEADVDAVSFAVFLRHLIKDG